MVGMPAGDERGQGDLLRVWHEPAPGGLVVHVAGEIDLVTAPQLTDELVAVEKQSPPPARLVLDLTEVTFLASVGLSALLDHDRRCREVGSKLQVVTGNRTVARSIVLTGLAETLTVFDTLDEAVAAGS